MRIDRHATAASRRRGAPSIPISIEKPDGAGPFPAVVILHDCSGLGPRSSGSPKRWADILVKQGYAVAIPDSFSTRGHEKGVCTVTARNRAEVAPARRGHDAYEALAYLRRQPFVDGARVAVMGGSHGGATTVLAMRGDRKDGFAAAVALYPNCNASAPYHAFDSANPVRYVETRANRNSPGGQGATTGGNAEAWADAIREVDAFLARHLRAR